MSPVPFGDGGRVGGGERAPYELAAAMARLTPTTYASYGSRVGRGMDGRLRVQTMPVRFRVREHELNPISEQLARLVAKHDTVHVHQWDSVSGNVAVVLARTFGKRVFVTDHGGWARNFRRQLRLHRIVDGSLDVSTFAGSFYPELADRQTTVLNGVDVDRFTPRATPDRGPHALFVGRLMPHKGIDVLIDALDPETPLRVVGRPYHEQYVETLQEKSRGKDVTFVFDADDEQLLEEYHGARCLVLPSLTEPEHGPPAPKAELLGLTLLEAMACGTPVVCTATGGMPEVVDDGRTGIVVAPHDRAALNDAVRKLTTANDWMLWSRRAREHVMRRFTWDVVAQRCIAAYARSLS